MDNDIQEVIERHELGFPDPRCKLHVAKELQEVAAAVNTLTSSTERLADKVSSLTTTLYGPDNLTGVVGQVKLNTERLEVVGGVNKKLDKVIMLLITSILAFLLNLVYANLPVLSTTQGVTQSE